MAGCRVRDLRVAAGRVHEWRFRDGCRDVPGGGRASFGVRAASVGAVAVVRFKDLSSLTVVDVPVSASGKFSVRLAPGTYSVVGVTSQMGLVDPHSTVSQPPCEMQNLDSIRVRAGQTDRVTLICYGP
jgi:hypothetical protein